MNINDLADLSFTQIADAYIDLRASGTAIPIEQLADAMPIHREKILRQLPVMVLLNDALENGEKCCGNDLTHVTIDGCRIEDEIGRGASAIVFRAHQPAFDRKVAVKVIDKRKKSDWVARFKIESRAMARLEHPHIVQPYSFIEYDDYDCLIMRYVDGFSLSQLIEEDCDYRGRLLVSNLLGNWDEFAVMAANVADAIAHAHERGIVHRDLKPSNLLIDRDGKVWVTDFGLTKILDDPSRLSRSGDAIGTLRYMSPEQMLGACDERSDIFSLGLTLYALASGSPTQIAGWQADPDHGLIDVKDLNPDIPKGLAQIIMKACRIDPIDRFQTAAELRIVLERYLDGRVPDRRRKPRYRDRFYIRNVKMRAGIVGSAAVVMASAYWAMNRPQETTRRLPSQTVMRDFVVTPAVQSSETLLDDILDDGTKAIDPVVHEVVRRRIDDSANNLHLSSEETNVLQERVDDLLQEDMLRQNSIGNLIDVYRESPLWIATRILRITRIVQLSDLPDAEKPDAIDTVRHLALLVAKQRVSIAEADALEKSLTFNKLMGSSEHSSIRMGEARMREWLGEVSQRIQHEPAVQDVSAEIEALFQQANSRLDTL